MTFFVSSIEFLNISHKASVDYDVTLYVLKLKKRNRLRLNRLYVNKVQLVCELVDILICFKAEEVLLPDNV